MSNWLPKFVKRSTETRQGDVIAAEVGEDARGVAVGKYILQIGTLAIPLWAVITVVVAAVAAVAFAGFNAFSTKAKLGQIAETVSATPTPTPRPKMEGEFNVAIAQFRVEGQGEGLDTAERLVQDFANQVEAVAGELKDALGEIEVRLPGETGSIAGEDVQARAAGARALAREIGADIVVYGVVAVDGDRATIAPEFYINDSVCDGLVEAWEITGQYEMGHALTVERLRNRDLRQQTAQQLGDRFQALASIIRGLSAFVAGNYPTAGDRFRDALAENAWDNREVLYGLLGSTSVNQGLLKEDPTLYAEGEGYYRQAIESNRAYARAYVGLAGVLYERARTSAGAAGFKAVDLTLLNEAIDTYERLQGPGVEQPPFADIAAKVHFGQGQAYLLKSLVLADKGEGAQASSLWEQARQAYRSVIDEYQAAGPEGQARLQERAAHAHARLGLMYRYESQFARARTEYELALEMVPKLPRVKIDQARYEAALGDIDLKESKLEDARKRYAQAAELVPAGLAEKKQYEEKVAQIQAQIDGGGNP